MKQNISIELLCYSCLNTFSMELFGTPDPPKPDIFFRIFQILNRESAFFMALKNPANCSKEMKRINVKSTLLRI